jgi:carbonic anhydrase
MRLFESIIDANHRAVAGDDSAGLRPADFADELPVIVLTCIDPRLNALVPNVLGIPAEQFIWLRNAGNNIISPLCSTMRSLVLACALNAGREIAIIGHTDCLTCKMTAMKLLDKLKALGVERSQLPDNLNEFFGVFAMEHQNVIKACDIARQSPLIGPKIPIHGLLVDIETGKLDWLVNGYDALQTPVAPGKSSFATSANPSMTELGAGPMADFHFGEMKFPGTKIGEHAANIQIQSPSPTVEPEPTKPAPRIPIPPVIRPHPNFTVQRR